MLLAAALAVAGCPSPTRTNGCPAATPYVYTFKNYCGQPIYIGQTAAAGNHKSFPPRGGYWGLAPRCTADGQCKTGQTCQVAQGQCTCGSDADCPAAAQCANGLCSTTTTFCMPKVWTSGTFWPRTGCQSDGGGLNCATGQCTPRGAQSGLLDCGVGVTSPTNPATQLEVTSNADGSANYDVSLVAGYNVELSAVPVGGSRVVPGTPASQPVACLSAGCTSDLNAGCPAALQFTASGSTVGCSDPCSQCQRNPGANNGSLQCTTQITTDASGNPPAATTNCAGGAGNPPTYQDMYCVQNFESDQKPLASSNQGTPTAFAQGDCFPGTTFFVPVFAAGYSLPAGQGVCVYSTPPQSTIPGFNDYGWHDFQSGTTQSCAALADGTACGGYLTGQADTHPAGMAYYQNALGYTCRTATLGALTAHLCMPPVSSGLAVCTADSLGEVPLYTAPGGVANASWLTAGLTAGGGATPYYATFKAACPSAYAWQYDDLASGFGCAGAALPEGKPLGGFDVTLCGSLSH
jgi:hypothetical protein